MISSKNLKLYLMQNYKRAFGEATFDNLLSEAQKQEDIFAALYFVDSFMTSEELKQQLFARKRKEPKPKKIKEPRAKIPKQPKEPRIKKGYSKQITPGSWPERAVQQLDKITNEVIAEHKSLSDAARSLGDIKYKGSIYIGLTKGYAGKGFKWKYA